MKRRVAWLAVTCVVAAAGLGSLPPTSRAAARPVTLVASLQSAASRATKLARTVAVSVIAVAFAAAAVVLAFRRDFKEAVGAFAVGIVAVLFASPAGMTLIKSTVASIFG